MNRKQVIGLLALFLVLVVGGLLLWFTLRGSELNVGVRTYYGDTQVPQTLISVAEQRKLTDADGWAFFRTRVHAGDSLYVHAEFTDQSRNSVSLHAYDTIFVDSERLAAAYVGSDLVFKQRGECPPGMLKFAGDCVERCPQGWYRFNDKCVANCPDGYEIFNGVCLALCDEGFVRDANGNCIPEKAPGRKRPARVRSSPTGKAILEIETLPFDAEVAIDGRPQPIAASFYSSYPVRRGDRRITLSYRGKDLWDEIVNVQRSKLRITVFLGDCAAAVNAADSILRTYTQFSGVQPEKVEDILLNYAVNCRWDELPEPIRGKRLLLIGDAQTRLAKSNILKLADAIRHLNDALPMLDAKDQLQAQLLLALAYQRKLMDDDAIRYFKIVMNSLKPLPPNRKAQLMPQALYGICVSTYRRFIEEHHKIEGGAGEYAANVKKYAEDFEKLFCPADPRCAEIGMMREETTKYLVQP